MTVRRTVVRFRRQPSLPARARRESLTPLAPYLGLVRSPLYPSVPDEARRELVVATYNVHRWTGLNGRRTPDPARAAFVVSELGADVIGLQEVLRPFEGDDPLVSLADALGLHLAFVTTRVHRLGELGNAVLSRFPIAGASLLDLSFSRLERRAAIAATVQTGAGPVSVVATHLALVDRTRHRQVSLLLEHPNLRSGPVLLLGDLNLWRHDRASRALEKALRGPGDVEWPPSFPAARPVLALDRVYARGAKLLELSSHRTPAARRASDHLPVVARVAFP